MSRREGAGASPALRTDEAQSVLPRLRAARIGPRSAVPVSASRFPIGFGFTTYVQAFASSAFAQRSRPWKSITHIELRVEKPTSFGRTPALWFP
jgi:hypothetical protein